MTLLLITFLGGILTILSPCILPVLPFVFARADRPFLTSTAPMLVGMAATFAGVATLAAVGGAWVVSLNQAGRWAALILLVFFGLTLLSRRLADLITRPFVAFGNKLSQSADEAKSSGNEIGSSLLIGVAVGFLWAPCAGPILGLVLTTAAINGASFNTSLLLLAYALGAATSLAVVLFAGNKVFAALKKSLGAGEWVRRGLGVAVLIGAGAIALGLDTGLLTQLSLGGSTTQLEQSLVNQMPGAKAETGAAELKDEGPMPSIEGGVEWLNSPPLTAEQLRGKVVVIDFWTYSCINCLRSLPYVRSWAEKYRDAGLVVIGVHAPEFAFERDPNNVRRAVKDLGLTYPVVLDNNLTIWRAFKNRFWPAHYFIDAKGQVRGHHFGEGSYDRSEQWIRTLLAEAGAKNLPQGIVDPKATGVSAASNYSTVESPETYVGFNRRKNFVSPETAQNTAALFTMPATLTLNQWGLVGDWIVHDENAEVQKPGGVLRFRFKARDLHLVLGPGEDRKPVRFRITIDGAAPGDNAGMDVNAAGEGTIREQQLYQLVRTKGDITERTFAIEFLDPGARAFAFTFG